MNLLRLKSNYFRNLAALNIEPSPGFNLIYGLNGSGKTSILETIYFLSLGRSFRTNLSNRIIQHEADGFNIFGQVQNNQGLTISTGVERNRQGKIRIKVGNEQAPTLVELARALPIQLINPDSYALLTDGPKPRREFTDWGVFHVEPQFFPLWQRFQRALKQRNSSLQQGSPSNQTKAWDNEITITAQELNKLRQEYIKKLSPLFFNIFSELLDIPEISFDYYQGWDESRGLQEVLDSTYHRDATLGYTQHGPQRADLIFKAQGLPVQDVLSRGEQKLFVIALRLAQGLLLQILTDKRCLYLLDDIAAELDSERRQAVVSYLLKLEAQVFVTAVDNKALGELMDNKNTKLFHVEHGRVDLTI